MKVTLAWPGKVLEASVNLLYLYKVVKGESVYIFFLYEIFTF